MPQAVFTGFNGRGDDQDGNNSEDDQGEVA